MSEDLRLPKSFDRLAAAFEESQEHWRRKVGAKALTRLPRRTRRHDDVGLAYTYLAPKAFRAGRFAAAAHYYRLGEEHARRHSGDRDLEDWEVESAVEWLDEAGWITGDWQRYERCARRSASGFSAEASIRAFTTTYVRWAILGARPGEDEMPPVEQARDHGYRQAEEFAKGRALAVARSLWVEDELAEAYFWCGRWADCGAAADRFLAAVEAWKTLDPKPRNVRFDRLGPQRDLARALEILAAGDDDEIRATTASHLLAKVLVAGLEEPASDSFEKTLLLVKAIARAAPGHELVKGFRAAFRHLEHLLVRHG